MELLLIVNSIIFGFLFVIWSKETFLNACIKTTLLGLLVFNGLQAYKVSEANRLERLEASQKGDSK